jgi:hypothetical protein
VPLLGCTFKRAAFVGRDMIGLVALDFVLRIVFRSVMHMTLVVEIRGVDGDDGPRHPACFRIPAYMIADLKNAVCNHPAVAQCAVIAIPSEEWGEAVHTIVILKEGCDAAAGDIIAHCRQAIAYYKCPRSIEFRSEPFPLSGAGKVLKRELRAPYWKGRARQVG